MTEEELAAIEARAKAATAGPWIAAERTSDDFVGEERGVVTGWNDGQLKGPVDITGLGIDLRTGVAVRRMRFSNAVFIAAARSDVPVLCAEIRRLRAALVLAEEGLRVNGVDGYAHDARETLGIACPDCVSEPCDGTPPAQD